MSNHLIDSHPVQSRLLLTEGCSHRFLFSSNTYESSAYKGAPSAFPEAAQYTFV